MSTSLTISEATKHHKTNGRSWQTAKRLARVWMYAMHGISKKYMPSPESESKRTSARKAKKYRSEYRSDRWWKVTSAALIRARKNPPVPTQNADAQK